MTSVAILILLPPGLFLPTAYPAERAPERVVTPLNVPLTIRAPSARTWVEKRSTLLLLEGHCEIIQSGLRLSANGALLWLESSAGDGKIVRVELYADENVMLALPDHEISPRQMPVHLVFETRAGLSLDAPSFKREDSPPVVPLYERALAWRAGKELPPIMPSPPMAGLAGVEIAAKESQFDLREGTTVITLRGNVRIGFEGRRVQADVVRVWIRQPSLKRGEAKPRLERLHAVGAVLYVENETTIIGDELYLNLVENRGLALGDVEVRTRESGLDVPLVLSTPTEICQVAKDRFIARQAQVTTCDFGRPHYHLQSSQIRAVLSRAEKSEPTKEESKRDQPTERQPKEQKPSGRLFAERYDRAVVTSTHNVLQFGAVPAFYWPHASYDLTRGGFILSKLRLGKSSELGSYVQTGWNLYDLGIYRNRWSDLDLNLDHYGRRGTGYGLDFDYDRPQASGFLTTYYIKDRQHLDEGNRPIEDDDRGRALWRHRHQLPGDWRADAEVAYLSDDGFLETYFEKEYDEGKEQETLLYLRKLSGIRGYTILLQERINSFQTVTAREPELTVHSIGQPFQNGRIVWTSHTSLAKLQKREDERLHRQNLPHVNRLDSNNELSAPFSLGPLQADPFLGLRVGAVSERVNDRGAAMRHGESYGLRTSTDFFRTFDAQSDLLEVNGLRHVLTPRVEYERRFYLSEPPREFIQHDDTDSFDLLHKVLIGFRNRLQTKRRGVDGMQSVDFLLLDVEYIQYPGDRGENQTRRDKIEGDLTWLVNDRLTLFSRGNEYNIQEDRMEVVGGGFSLNLLPPVSVEYEHQFVDIPHEKGEDKSIGILRFGYAPRYTRWRADLETRYDFKAVRTSEETKNPKQLGTQLSFTRDLHCWLVSFSVEYDKGRRNDTVIRLSIEPKGIGRARLKL